MDQSYDMRNKIIRYIIKATPFGQAKEVVKDLCKIINGLNPQDEALLKALKEHNEDHLAVIRKDNDPKNYIITCILNSQEDFYVDQKKNLTIKVDHSNLSIAQTDPVDLPQDDQLNAFRDALELNLQAYLNSYYKDQLSGFYVMYTGDSTNWNIYIGISAKNINLPNFYCGDWISKWEVSSSELKGDLTVHAHYYEEGNVQLKNTNKFSSQLNLNIASPVEAAKDVVGAIEKLENKHQNSVEKLYDQMPDLFFKAMRRQLPVTGTKMDWNANVHKVVQSLKQS